MLCTELNSLWNLCVESFFYEYFNSIVLRFYFFCFFRWMYLKEKRKTNVSPDQPQNLNGEKAIPLDSFDPAQTTHLWINYQVKLYTHLNTIIMFLRKFIDILFDSSIVLIFINLNSSFCKNIHLAVNKHLIVIHKITNVNSVIQAYI